jgi:pimeloyl-ACP methyl ester carboxylesterase
VDELTEESVWLEYYDAFSYFTPDAVRPLCHPKKWLHSGGSDKSIVLVHGLTDCPYSMQAIALHFYQELGYDVYLPLLQCHGLKDANGMRGVRLSAWKDNVHFAVEAAAQGGRTVSIGGLSTGGALAFSFAASHSKVEGELYLFSAAFGLYGGIGNLLTPLLEGFLKLPFIPLLTSGSSLVVDNPYRYRRVPFISARELVYLMDENKLLLQAIKDGKAFDTRVFSAWSEGDRVVRIDLLAEFESILKVGHFTPYIIPEKACVVHACVVLAEQVFACDSGPGDSPIELANPHFFLMLDSLDRFEAS